MFAYRNQPNQPDLPAINSLIRKVFDDMGFFLLCYDYFPQVYQYVPLDSPYNETKVQHLLEYCQQVNQLDTLLSLIRDENPSQFLEYDPYFRQQVAPQHRQEMSQQVHFYIAYHAKANHDYLLANYLYHFLTKLEHTVYINRIESDNQISLREIDQQIKQSHYLIALLSHRSVDNEMLRAKVAHAYDHYQEHHRPKALFVTMAYNEPLPYSIELLIPHANVLCWETPPDHERIGLETLQVVERKYGTSANGKKSIQFVSPSRKRTITDETIVSEDGLPIVDEAIMLPPLPEYDPRFLEALTAPGGAVKLRDQFYIERKADQLLRRELSQPYGTTTTIRASRQMGKSSLLVRGMNDARQRQAKIVYLDLQGTDHQYLVSFDLFLRYLANTIVRKLRLNPAIVDTAWQSSLGAKDKLTYLMEDEVLRPTHQPIVLALDEVDLIVQPDHSFHTEFFSLLRSWHNNRAVDFEGLWDKLFIVMAISTEPYLLIRDVNQSPFNVGLKLYLEDFDPTQVYELNWRHGAPIRSAEFGNFMQLLNGHPYLTRKALYTMVTQPMSWSTFAQVADDDNGPFSDHLLRHYWLLMNDKLGLATALKAIIRNNRYNDEVAILRLLKAGLIKGEGNFYTCRCDLYRRYFEGRL